VLTTFFWCISGQHYLGELVFRHELTRALAESGGHIGYGVAPSCRSVSARPSTAGEEEDLAWLASSGMKSLMLAVTSARLAAVA
jgi:hypothetical protein